MTVPRDKHEEDRVGAVRVARHISNLISPPTMFAAIGLALGAYERPYLPGLAWGVLYALIVTLTPMMVITYLLRSGRIEDLHMSRTSDRHIPYLVAVLSGIIAYGVVYLFNGPDLLQCLAMFNIITLGALGIINTRWLISIHATAAGATWLIATLIFGPVVGLILLPLVILICYIRLFLKRHTLAQVLAGVALGLTIVLILRAFGCFLP
jgi:membrane-associated phospholipid phosphatase